ncbi:MAG: ribonuclease HII [Chloroflexi bacterium]|nr:ribonuclease HII [Chloroflexota bacterium]
MQAPTFAKERELSSQGYRFIAGVDEVGRGALAGPVVAAAVILPLENDFAWLSRVRDSKQLTPRRREQIFELIRQSRIAIGIGMTSHTDIDAIGIVKATRMAMGQAVRELAFSPDCLLIDALSLPGIPLPQWGIVRGDQLSLSIACASIVAKVTRDRYMTELDRSYPGYGLARHKGYGTRQHLASLCHLGACPIHRQSFVPVRRLARNGS